MNTDEDGESRCQAVRLEGFPEWCSKMSTDHITFRTDPPGRTDPSGTFGNWHTAPRR